MTVKFAAALAILLALASPVLAQSSQTMTGDLVVLKHNVQVCIEDYGYFKRHGKPVPAMTREQLRKFCIERAVRRYRERVQAEEQLIEDMTKFCCPNIKTPPAMPHYQERKEYQVERPTDTEREGIEQIIAKLKESTE